MSKARVHILTAVNAGAVSKTGSTYRIANVVGCVDDLVMNSMLYPADQLAAGAPSLEGKPAPAGHPKDGEGRHISALSGNALLTSYAGAICTNARHEGGKTLFDVVVNEAQAKAHPDGAALVARLDAAMNGTNTEPIHVSTGLFCQAVQANGESMGKKYQRIATNIQYDHVAFLLHEAGAGTPEQGVGMFLNAEGKAEPVECAVLNAADAADQRSTLRRWVQGLLGNAAASMSFEQITEGLYKALPRGAWLREVFDSYAIWTDEGGKFWKQTYAVSEGGFLAWSGTAEEVRREVTYSAVVNSLPKGDPMKETLVAVLNAAGIKTEGLADAQLLAAYNAHVAAQAVAPVQSKLDAANSQLQTMQANAQAAEAAELAALATQLATNAKGFTADDFKAMGLKRCKELAANASLAAPVVPGSTTTAKPGDEFASYSVNALIDAAKA